MEWLNSPNLYGKPISWIGFQEALISRCSFGTWVPDAATQPHFHFLKRYVYFEVTEVVSFLIVQFLKNLKEGCDLICFIQWKPFLFIIFFILLLYEREIKLFLYWSILLYLFYVTYETPGS